MHAGSVEFCPLIYPSQPRTPCLAKWSVVSDEVLDQDIDVAARKIVQKGRLQEPLHRTFSAEARCSRKFHFMERTTSIMIIDAHVHYGYAERLETKFANDLVQLYQRLGIQKAVVMGLGMVTCKPDEPDARKPDILPPPSGGAWERWGNHNDDVLALFKTNPDFVLPVAWFRLDDDDVSLIDEFASRGFCGLKFHHPRENYDSDAYFPIYERAAAKKLVFNFHTGFCQGGVSSATLRVQHVEAVARTFSDTTVIVSHFGFPDYEAAGAIARIAPKFYLDISPSGSPAAPPDLVRHDLKERKLIGHHLPVEKLLFGTDIYLERTEDTLQKWAKLFSDIGLSASDREQIWHRNARHAYSLDR